MRTPSDLMDELTPAYPLCEGASTATRPIPTCENTIEVTSRQVLTPPRARVVSAEPVRSPWTPIDDGGPDRSSGRPGGWWQRVGARGSAAVHAQHVGQ